MNDQPFMDAKQEIQLKWIDKILHKLSNFRSGVR